MTTGDHKILGNKEVAVIGVPFNAGQPREGVEGGPMKLIESGLLEQIKELGWQPSYQANDDLDDLRPAHDPVVNNLINPKFVSAVTQRLADQIFAYASKRQFVLTLGGDHSLGLATVSGIFRAYPDACLFWVDAHADINTPESTPSGNIHGCPISFLAGLATHPDFEWVKAVLRPERLVYIALRDVDEGEKRIIKDLGIKAFSMHEVDAMGIGRVMELAMDAVNPDRSRPIHLSFDVDALDPSVAPSTGTPVRGGLTFREGHYICEYLAATKLMVSMDVVEVNPALEDEEAAYRTIQVGCSVARSGLGESLL
ncbi:arginase [Gongronella butleri]|nr:arginase [Gongronella butleri]